MLLSAVLCIWLCFALMLASRWVKAKSLQAAITTELYRLSVNLTATELRPALPSGFGNCKIPLNVHSACVDTTEAQTPAPPCPLEDLSRDCDLLKVSHGYDQELDAEEIEFPLAFGMKMHTSPEQAEQLLRTIYRPHNVYCIHVDKKALDGVFSTMQSIAACFSNVFLTDRVNFIYAGFETVKVELMLMECALRSRVKWKYYLNLAGQEFPLRTNLEMVHIFKLLNGTNDISSFPMPDRLQKRVSHVYQVKDNKMVKTSVPKDPPPFEVEIRKGTQYGSFSRDFVTFLFRDKLARSVIDFFSDTYSPDETVWATINASPGAPGGFEGFVKHTPDNEHLSRAVAWKGSDLYECHGIHVRSVCIFSRWDLPWLLRQPNLVVNKLVLQEDEVPLQCLEAVLRQRAATRTVTVDELYVRDLPYMRNRQEQQPGSSR